MKTTNRIEVWYDNSPETFDALGRDAWTVSLCFDDGEEIRCLSRHDDEASALEAGETEASARGLQLIVRDAYTGQIVR